MQVPRADAKSILSIDDSDTPASAPLHLDHADDARRTGRQRNHIPLECGLWHELFATGRRAPSAGMIKNRRRLRGIK